MFINNSINDSSTLSAFAGADLTSNRFVKYNTDGSLVPADKGDIPAGILLESNNNPSSGQSVSFLIKDIALVLAADELIPGDLVSCGPDGLALRAADGDFIAGICRSAAPAGSPALIQFTLSGFMGG